MIQYVSIAVYGSLSFFNLFLKIMFFCTINESFVPLTHKGTSVVFVVLYFFTENAAEHSKSVFFSRGTIFHQCLR